MIIIRNLAILLLLGCFAPAIAGGTGYINYDKVVSEYRFAQTTLREIQTKADEIEKYLQAKEEEFSKIESAVQKKKFETNVQNEMKTKEAAFNDFRNKKEEIVYNKIHAVSEKIRLEKGLDAILDARCVFSGGTDITDELITKLNSTN